MRLAENMHLNFEQFLEYGRAQVNPRSMSNNMPWSFQICGMPVTHDRDDCYLIGANWVDHYEMGPLDLLVIEDGQVSVRKGVYASA